MRSVVKLLISLIILFNLSFVNAQPHSTAWYSEESGKKVKINVELFLSSTCKHCTLADNFFTELENKDNDIVVHRYFINQDKAALQAFYERLQQQDSSNYSVPAIFFCDSRWVGFANAESSGAILVRALDYCRQQISQHGQLSPATVNVLRQWGIANQIQIHSTTTNAPATFLILSALIDAFNPSTLFGIMAFLAFLSLCPKQKRLQFYTGIIFIGTLGVMHYIAQVHSSFYYSAILGLRLPAAVVGVLLLLYVHYYRKRVLAQSLVYGLIVLAVIVIQGYQQTTALNMALAFEQWLVQQPVSTGMQMLYHLLYQMLYVLPSLLLLAVYLRINHRQRIARHTTMFSIWAGLILGVIGVLLVIYPPLLSNLMFSAMVFIVSLLGAWLLRRRVG